MFPRAPRPHQILAGGVEGESGYMPVSAGVVSPGLPFEDFRFVINLPAGKTCDYCVLQLLWAARSNDTYHTVTLFMNLIVSIREKTTYCLCILA